MAQIFIIFILITAVWWVYWILVRPVMLLRIRLEIFRLRHCLRTLKADETTPQVKRLLEGYCNICIKQIPYLDIADVLWAIKSKTAALNTDRDLELIEASPEPSKKIFQRLMLTSMGTTVLNSPVIWPVAMLVAFLAIWFRAFTKMIEHAKRGAWAYTIYPDRCVGQTA